MTTLVGKALRELVRNRADITLPEMVVVVGIVVALAAVIFPSDGTSSGESDASPLGAERPNVEEVLGAYHADEGETNALDNEIRSIVEEVLAAQRADEGETNAFENEIRSMVQAILESHADR